MGKDAENYERQRELRIAQNKATIDSLGLKTIASGLTGLVGKKKSKSLAKSKSVAYYDKADVDYEPESDDEDSIGSELDGGHDQGYEKVIHLAYS